MKATRMQDLLAIVLTGKLNVTAHTETAPGTRIKTGVLYGGAGG